MKKTISIILVLLMLLSITACAVDYEDPTEETKQTEASVLEQPPEMTIQCGSDIFTTRSGNYSWTSQGINGEMGAVIACGSHPLDDFRTQEFRTVTDDALILSFPVAPDEITVIRWSKDYVGFIDEPGETAEIKDMTIPMEAGSWVYQIIASWNGDIWSGQAEYHLYLTK